MLIRLYKKKYMPPILFHIKTLYQLKKKFHLVKRLVGKLKMIISLYNNTNLFDGYLPGEDAPD